MHLCFMQEGHKVNVRLKIGQMTCLEYAAMKGYDGVLSALINKSELSEEIRQYFSMDGKRKKLLRSTFKIIASNVPATAP